MEHITLLIGIVIVTALAFDFTNGFNDTASAMATTISTGALSPRKAVGMAAVLNLVGAFLSVQVAKTISGGIINEGSGVHPQVIFAALVGAISWNLTTWLAGLPSSSSHALFGGLIGATLASVGTHGVNGNQILLKIVIPAAAAPLVAGTAAMVATRLTYRLSRGRTQQDTARGYRAGQIASAALVALAHGTNDAQKTMGVITLALITGDVLPHGSNPPLWVICSAAMAIGLGTFLGGWRIIRTLGKGITDIQPPQGFAAQTGAATVILASSHLGFALSTTQVCSGAVMGAGVGRKGSPVRWSTAGRMVIAWCLTLPSAGLVAALAALLADQGDWGVTLVAVLAISWGLTARMISRRNPVTHANVNEVEPVSASSDGVVTTALRTVAPPPTGRLAAGGAADGSGDAASTGGTEPTGSTEPSAAESSGAESSAALQEAASKPASDRPLGGVSGAADASDAAGSAGPSDAADGPDRIDDASGSDRVPPAPLVPQQPAGPGQADAHEAADAREAEEVAP